MSDTTGARNRLQELADLSYVEALFAQVTASDPQITSYEVVSDEGGTITVGMQKGRTPISLTLNVTP